MDHLIQKAIEAAYASEQESGIVFDQWERMNATFVAVERLAETQNLAAIEGCPAWLVNDLNTWVNHYRTTGKFGFVSNVGESDHSLLMRKVAHLFD